MADVVEYAAMRHAAPKHKSMSKTVTITTSSSTMARDMQFSGHEVR